MTWTRADTSAIPNFRDVGGHPTLDGHNVRTGLLYRSVDLFGLNEAATELADWLGRAHRHRPAHGPRARAAARAIRPRTPGR